MLEDLEKEAEMETFITKRMNKEMRRRSNQHQSSRPSKNDVSEVYSRPRVSQCAQECGMRPG
eukprot:6908284-Karenia_brevis.AAC.1